MLETLQTKLLYIRTASRFTVVAYSQAMPFQGIHYDLSQRLAIYSAEAEQWTRETTYMDAARVALARQSRRHVLPDTVAPNTTPQFNPGESML